MGLSIERIAEVDRSADPKTRELLIRIIGSDPFTLARKHVARKRRVCLWLWGCFVLLFSLDMCYHRWGWTILPPMIAVVTVGFVSSLVTIVLETMRPVDLAAYVRLIKWCHDVDSVLDPPVAPMSIPTLELGSLERGVMDRLLGLAAKLLPEKTTSGIVYPQYADLVSADYSELYRCFWMMQKAGLVEDNLGKIITTAASMQKPVDPSN